jgi:RNA polymerase sigma-70 factor, ECF subfamily
MRCDPDELASMARSGDLESLDRLTRCYGERLLSVGRRVCANEDQAEDAVQDALLQATERLDQYRGEGRLDSWLARMVANACHRMRRGRKNDPGLHLTEAEVADRLQDPERSAARAELSRALNRSLLSLAPEDRAIVLLSDVEGWKGPEIAERLGMGAAATRKRLSRARAALRDDLGVAVKEFA